MTHLKLIAPMFEEMMMFAPLGEETASNGALLIGKAPHVGKKAFLHTLYPPLEDGEIGALAEKDRDADSWPSGEPL